MYAPADIRQQEPIRNLSELVAFSSGGWNASPIDVITTTKKVVSLFPPDEVKEVSCMPSPAALIAVSQRAVPGAWPTPVLLQVALQLDRPTKTSAVAG